MKKLLGLILAGIVCVGMVGCSEESTEVEEKETKKVEAPKEEKKEEYSDKVEILNRDDKEFDKHISTAMSDEEYVKYFESIKGVRGDFNATIMDIHTEEGKSTVYEILVACESGPYVKLNNIQLSGSDVFLEAGDEVKVSGLIKGYNVDYGYLELQMENVRTK